jgi:hypothetical protein
MQFRKLETIKARHPKLSQQLDSLAAYITEQLGDGRKEIEPALASRSLKLTEAEVLALLMLLEREGMVRHHYNIYCAHNRTLLKTVHEKAEIPSAIYCKYCDKEHCDPDEFEIELAFQVLEPAWEPLRQNVAAR